MDGEFSDGDKVYIKDELDRVYEILSIFRDMARLKTPPGEEKRAEGLDNLISVHDPFAKLGARVVVLERLDREKQAQIIELQKQINVQKR